MAGIVLVDGAIPSLQSSNLTPRLSATSPDLSEIKPWGLTGTSSIKSLWDLNASLGGPVAVDKVWFYGTGRGTTSESYLAGHYFPVDPSARVRVIDPSRQVSDDQYSGTRRLRLTSAVTPKMRWTNFGIYQHKIFQLLRIQSVDVSRGGAAAGLAALLRADGLDVYGDEPAAVRGRLELPDAGDTSARIRDDQVTGTRYVETGGNVRRRGGAADDLRRAGRLQRPAAHAHPGRQGLDVVRHGHPQREVRDRRAAREPHVSAIPITRTISSTGRRTTSSTRSPSPRPSTNTRPTWITTCRSTRRIGGPRAR